MNKEIEKLLFNPIRLKIISFLINVEHGNFKALLEITDSTKGNLSIQLKKLNEAKLIKIKKYFQRSYPKTDYSITKKGRKNFEDFFKQLELYNKKK
ncbi:MAG: transcriptional regulator [Flavobacteriaceae bacterium]